MRILDPHTGLEFLAPDECRALLAARSGQVGRIAFAEGDRVVVLPVNYALADDHLAFRTAHGAKLSHALDGGAASFEVDALDEVTQTGWSVLVHGRARAVVAPEEVARLDALDLRVWATHAQKTSWVVVSIDSVTGRRIDLLTER